MRKPFRLSPLVRLPALAKPMVRRVIRSYAQILKNRQAEIATARRHPPPTYYNTLAVSDILHPVGRPTAPLLGTRRHRANCGNLPCMVPPLRPTTPPQTPSPNTHRIQSRNKVGIVKDPGLKDPGLTQGQTAMPDAQCLGRGTTGNALFPRRNHRMGNALSSRLQTRVIQTRVFDNPDTHQHTNTQRGACEGQSNVF